jgi:uncharacterized surface protein with fasciclin (FAS1) repeats
MRRSMAALALPLVAVLALTACSDDSDSNDEAATETTSSAPAEAGTIVEVASETPALSTLVTAVTAADLGATLSGPGPYTVFAPTNDAFAALPAGVLDNLLLPCNKDALTSILTYHVVSGEVGSADITPGDVATVEGSTVALATDNGVTVNEATVTIPDVAASNGVVHVIDGVLVPETVDPAALATSC